MRVRMCDAEFETRVLHPARRSERPFELVGARAADAHLNGSDQPIQLSQNLDEETVSQRMS